jgi:mono/diheme cytochrome c family protein
MFRTAGAFALVAACLVGCKEAESTSPASGAAAPGGPMAKGKGGPQGPAKDGKEVFQGQGCMRCHSVGEAGGKKGKGPDLSQVGADPTHTKDWLVAYVKNPKETNPTSHMPSFAGKISDAEFVMLGDYLAGLK